MSVRASIISLVVLLCLFAVGYAFFVDDRQAPIHEAANSAPDDAVEQQTDGQTSALQGSADRRMDDFGAGPGGKVVTVPLRDRYRNAYGSGSTGGGAPLVAEGRSASGDLEQAEEQVVALSPSEQDDQGQDDKARYRIIEREPTGQEGEAGITDKPDAERPAAPSFDVVRVDPEGNTVLAGRASPFADVEVKVGDEVIDRVTATGRGEWVSTPIRPLQQGDQELSLLASSDNEEPVVSRQVVVVSIPETAERETADAAKPVAVLLNRAKSGEGRVLQAPGTLRGEGKLALKLVDYDDEGAIKLSGEAPPGASIRIYIDNEPAAVVIGDSKGQWITTLDQGLPGGDYTLRLDQLGKDGDTVARLETPFTRVTTPPVEGQSKVDYVVVQPGNSLWRIARRLSGDGFNYVYLFEANQAQIRDPDVIYPGQVFEVPQTSGIAG